MLMDSSLDYAVQVISFSEARESFKAVLDRVEADADVTLITRRHAKGAVVMSLWKLCICCAPRPMRPICSGRWGRPGAENSSLVG